MTTASYDSKLAILGLFNRKHFYYEDITLMPIHLRPNCEDWEMIESDVRLRSFTCRQQRGKSPTVDQRKRGLKTRNVTSIQGSGLQPGMRCSVNSVTQCGEHTLPVTERKTTWSCDLLPWPSVAVGGGHPLISEEEEEEEEGDEEEASHVNKQVGGLRCWIQKHPIRHQQRPMMSWVKQRYHDISPVTLQVVGGAVSSTLYCGEVDGLSLVESFLVELYRCKLCQFTCGLKTSISSHQLLRHRPLALPYLGPDERDGVEAGLQRGASPYQLDLNGESKQSDEDEEFLLYNMLDNMSPSTCDISSEGGLQVAHTCEVSTLFEEEGSSIFPLKGGDLSCPINPPSTQEEMEQSAHLMTLGLCRISAVRPPPSPPPPASSPPTQHSPPPADPPGRRRMLCHLCPLALPSRRLLDIHVRSHRPAGGFGCVRCSQTAASWAEMEPHWRSHCRRKKKEAVCGRRKTSDRWRARLIGRSEAEEAKNVCVSRAAPRAASPQNVSAAKRKSRREEEGAERLSCSLCHRKFSSKLTLRRHLGVHGGEKPFTCPHCSYRSRLKASLLQHLRTHTGEKPYRCSECPYASIDRSSLLRHCRTHSQEKPYRCHHCDYSSIQKKSLDLHARRHHTGEVFPCQQCEYSSADRQLLLKHIRRHHPPQQAAL
ncbi:uncharacterized protein [Leuresthes tenuis]|uniref:uncharacterized protein n=1 Tax=Leuresthes tenuis TaxID=355514 RepID=UPI003B5023EE